MNTPQKITHHEQFIADNRGKVQYVVVSAEEYNIMSDIIEEYGLGLAMKKALKTKTYSKKEALRFLDND